MKLRHIPIRLQNQAVISSTDVSRRPSPLKMQEIAKRGWQMLASSWGKIGCFATVPPLNRRTVHADCYVHHCVLQILTIWRQSRQKRDLSELLLLHVNAIRNDRFPCHQRAAAGTTSFTLFSRPLLLRLVPVPSLPIAVARNQVWSADIAVGEFTRNTDTKHESTPLVTWSKWFEWMARCVAASSKTWPDRFRR